MSNRLKWFTAGTLFAVLWASASTATKIGLASSQPLTIAVTRFGLAAAILLPFTHLVRRNRLPSKTEWKQLTIYGLLNISIYLGLYVVSMQYVTAGIGSLAVATNPVFISFSSVFFLGKKITPAIVIGIVLCTAGVVCAAWPLFRDATVTAPGLLILLISMLSYSAGAVYFAAKKWNGLHLLTINGWQTLLGGLMLLPVALIFYKDDLNHFDSTFWLSVSWLAIPVSIFAVLLWLWLLQKNAIGAGLWLFLCPLFGFIIAAWLVNDPITWYTVFGVVLVISGLFIAQKK